MNLVHDKWFLTAQLYSRLYGFFKDNFNINIRGLGFCLRRVKTDHVLVVNGRKLYFGHKMAEAYVRSLGGKWNEPETHNLISYVMDNLKASFIDVGANIGEIFVDIAAHPSCSIAIAFEPNPDAVSVINKNIALNCLSNCKVINKAMGHTQQIKTMSFGSHSPTSSLLSKNSVAGIGVDVEVSSLDYETDISAFPASNIILLIDVEGYELNVIRGGKSLISDSRAPRKIDAALDRGSV